MIAGRKLLLADDSLAIQKVIDLTFSDEGMEVAIVGDGDDALEKLDEFTPDVVLADVYMPGVDGYELCKFIKQSERFRGIPVMLLIGSFEPFDQAEAERVGADDVVTKPFQSIRQLVSRVGSLLSHEEAEKKDSTAGYSTLGIDQAEGTYSVADSADAEEHPNVRVFVEAPVMAEADSATPTEHTCPPNIEIQTADTRKLEPIDDRASEMYESDIDDTIEIEVLDAKIEPDIIEYETLSSAPREQMIDQSKQTAVACDFGDVVLDLGDVYSFVSRPAEEDFILDLDIETVTASTLQPTIAETQTSSYDTGESAASSDAISEKANQEVQVESSPVEAQEWMFSHGAHQGTTEATQESGSVEASHAHSGNLSPEAIDAISRRVVEQLSEKVVREIAWEVVPELSELLIKQRLSEQK